jgi:hypothetical protein
VTYRARHTRIRMTHKIIFTSPFYLICGAQLLRLLDVTSQGYKASLVTPAQPTSSCMISLCSSTSFPMAKKRKQEGVILAYREAVPFSLWFHGRVGLAYASGHARAPTKSYKSGIYHSGGTSYLSCSYKSCIPRSSGGIHCGVLDIL